MNPRAPTLDNQHGISVARDCDLSLGFELGIWDLGFGVWDLQSPSVSREAVEASGAAAWSGIRAALVVVRRIPRRQGSRRAGSGSKPVRMAHARADGG